jgi:hypothetical protein
MDISRRQLAGLVLAGTTAAAQTPPAQPPDNSVDAARARQRASAQAIARVPLPISTEPAFQFKAS